MGKTLDCECLKLLVTKIDIKAISLILLFHSIIIQQLNPASPDEIQSGAISENAIV